MSSCCFKFVEDLDWSPNISTISRVSFHRLKMSFIFNVCAFCFHFSLCSFYFRYQVRCPQEYPVCLWSLCFDFSGVLALYLSFTLAHRLFVVRNLIFFSFSLQALSFTFCFLALASISFVVYHRVFGTPILVVCFCAFCWSETIKSLIASDQIGRATLIKGVSEFSTPCHSHFSPSVEFSNPHLIAIHSAAIPLSLRSRTGHPFLHSTWECQSHPLNPDEFRPADVKCLALNRCMSRNHMMTALELFMLKWYHMMTAFELIMFKW